MPGKRILIDRNVRDWFVLIRPAEPREKVVQWGPHTVSAKLPGFRRKRMDDKRWAQVRCLPTIARLAREKHLTLFTYSELIFEGMHSGRKFYGSCHDLLRGVELAHVDMAVERSYFHQTSDFSAAVSGDALAAFIDEFLLPLDAEKFLQLVGGHPHFPKYLIDNLRNLDRFRLLCENLTRDQRRDAMHLWTAEVNGLDYYLTMDGKFRNVMVETKKVGCHPTRVVLPHELVDALGVGKLDDFPVPEGDYIPYMELLRSP